MTRQTHLDVFTEQFLSPVLHELVKRVRIGPVDVNLRHYGKCDAVPRHEGADLLRAAGLLAAKLVAREPNDLRAAGALVLYVRLVVN